MNPDRIVMGTCDGTGAAINVCLGFVPKYVKLWNLEDAGSKWPSCEWINPDFIAITAADEGVLDADDGTQVRRTLLASAGISPYNGGDEMIYDGVTSNRWEDAAGTSVEETYVDGWYERDAVGDTAYKCVGTRLLGRTPTPADNGSRFKAPAGFKIGTNADLNADTEQLVWLAMG